MSKIVLTEKINTTDQGYYRLRVYVSEAVGIGPEIFLYQMGGTFPGQPEEEMFSNVCSVPDLDEYPVDEPSEGSIFFRKSNLDLTFRSLEYLNVTRDAIRLHVDELLQVYDKLESEGEDATYISGS